MIMGREKGRAQPDKKQNGYNYDFEDTGYLFKVSLSSEELNNYLPNTGACVVVYDR